MLYFCRTATHPALSQELCKSTAESLCTLLTWLWWCSSTTWLKLSKTPRKKVKHFFELSAVLCAQFRGVQVPKIQLAQVIIITTTSTIRRYWRRKDHHDTIRWWWLLVCLCHCFLFCSHICLVFMLCAFWITSQTFLYFFLLSVLFACYTTHKTSIFVNIWSSSFI